VQGKIAYFSTVLGLGHVKLNVFKIWGPVGSQHMREKIISQKQKIISK
jgi:hypothetical protein